MTIHFKNFSPLSSEDLTSFRRQFHLSEAEAVNRLQIFVSGEGKSSTLLLEGNTFWATQNQIAKIFGVCINTVSAHLQDIFSEGEIDEDIAVAEFTIATDEGHSHTSNLYHLNAVVSVGYRIGSVPGTEFRIWANDRLFAILTKEFRAYQEKLKDQARADATHKIREAAHEIRASTSSVYREVKRLCSLCIDYKGDSEKARAFYENMENKLLWASASMTAAEIILSRADAREPDMGLTYYSGKRGPTKKDVRIANNYLAKGEAKTKNRITTMWLDYIVNQLEMGRLVTMKEVTFKLDRFIKFNNWPLLKRTTDASREAADVHALNELELFKTGLSQAA